MATKSELSDELKNSFEMADWFYKGIELNKEYQSSSTLSAIASELARTTFPHTPHIQNELVNHESISSNAVKARKQLMYQMLNKYGEDRLGYSGSSSDAGLFYSVIEQNHLYQWIGDRWVFTTTDQEDDWAKHFYPIWQAADKLLKASKGSSVTLTEIYQKWQAPPIGVRKGLLPIFALIYFLANRQHLGLYIENTFITDLNEAYLDEWMQITDRVAFKYVEIGKNEKDLLKSLSESLTKKLGKPVADSPLESARGLVHLVANLPGWTKRTSNISPDAQSLRRLLLKASDPLKVIFTDLPEILRSDDAKSLINKISDLTEELQNSYPAMLEKFKILLFKALDSHGSPEDLRNRASELKGMAGEFKIDGFVANLSVYKGDQESLESLLSATIHKNPKDWVDRDQELAINTLGEICSKFRRIETLGSLRGKSSKRSAFAFVYSDPNNSTVSDLFDISEERMPEIQKISTAILDDLKNQGLSKDEMLATFSNACSKIIKANS